MKKSTYLLEIINNEPKKLDLSKDIKNELDCGFLSNGMRITVKKVENLKKHRKTTKREVKHK